jgi:hypothetical protein
MWRALNRYVRREESKKAWEQSQKEKQMQINLVVGEQEYDAIQAALAYFSGGSLIEAFRIASKSTNVPLNENGVSRLRVELERQRNLEQREEKPLARAIAAGDVDFDERLSG